MMLYVVSLTFVVTSIIFIAILMYVDNNYKEIIKSLEIQIGCLTDSYKLQIKEINKLQFENSRLSIDLDCFIVAIRGIMHRMIGCDQIEDIKKEAIDTRELATVLLKKHRGRKTI